MYVYGYVITLYIICTYYDVVEAYDAKENYLNSVIKNTLMATAHACMDHVSATIDDLEKLRINEPPYPEKSACIIKCLLEKVSIVKNNKYSKNGFMTTVAPLVFANKKKMEHMRMVSENCDKEINHSYETPCQIGNEVVVCLYKYAPELHFKA